jgi:hypothetical protein
MDVRLNTWNCPFTVWRAADGRIFDLNSSRRTDNALFPIDRQGIVSLSGR